MNKIEDKKTDPHISAVRRAAAMRSAEVRAAPPSATLRVRKEAINAAQAASKRSGRSVVDWASDALITASRGVLADRK